jgi:type IV secretion system protein VirB10
MSDPYPSPPPDDARGDRDPSLIARALSAQARAGNVLAIGLMCALGLGSLAWYYAHALTREARVRDGAREASAQRAQGDAPLPSLGRISAPATAPATVPVIADAPAPEPPPFAQTLPEVPLAPSPAASGGAAPTKTPEQLELERRLSGTVFAAHDPGVAERPVVVGEPSAQDAVPAAGELGGWLRPGSTTAAVRAQRLPAQRLLLPKGAFLDCTLETAIDSTLPGMTTCVLATDAFGVDGNVVLLERGTKLIGETRGQVQQGSARIFVLWTEARTPAGVIVPLDSPGADELGRSGLPGEVSRHFWQRFGAAMLVSVIDGAVAAAAQARSGGNAITVNPSASQDVLTEILKNTINIPPTVVKRNGDRIQVLVARDLDFRSVYELRSASR